MSGPVVLVHIPKTAGSTLIRVLMRGLTEKEVVNPGNWFRDPAACRARVRAVTGDGAVRLVAGHLPLELADELGPGARLVTFLRDPVERMLSEYSYLREVRPEIVEDEGVTLERYLTEARFPPGSGYPPDNLQTRMLSRMDEPAGACSREALELAKRNLRERFAVVGVAERFDESLLLAQRALGLRSVLYASERVTRVRLRAEDVPPETRELIERRHHHDRELHAYACELLDERVAEQGPHFALEVRALREASRAFAGGGSQVPSPSGDDGEAAFVAARADLLLCEAARDSAQGQLEQCRAEAAALRSALERSTQREQRLQAKLDHAREALSRAREPSGATAALRRLLGRRAGRGGDA